MADTIHIAVDAMGGDFGPRLCVPASQNFLVKHRDACITLVGDEAVLRPYISKKLPRVAVVHTPSAVAMAERPSVALRHKSDSSMSLAIKLVAEKEAQACVSAGNTGALMAFGMKHLQLLPGIDRPAICKELPSGTQSCWMLDLGASLECTSEQLLQFARMGSVVARQHGRQAPRVALLNVGMEEQKGRELQQQAARLLADCFAGQYIGFIEGGDIFRGKADVVVCDGFTGNVVLKASEGVVEFLQQSLEKRFNSSLSAKFLACFAMPLLNSWRKSYELSSFNGALLLGLAGVLVKSHGGASVKGFESAISVAYEQVLNNTVDSIRQGLNV